jgi:hypothetical protein
VPPIGRSSFLADYLAPFRYTPEKLDGCGAGNDSSIGRPELQLSRRFGYFM